VNRRVTFRPEAHAEALVTRDWYEDRRPELGAVFRAALDEVIDRIIADPLMFQRVRDETRRAVLDRFPYAVYFRVAADEMVALAVHGRQRPRRWQSRT
jgi:plasmid stabilization system protein ParE